MSKVSSLKFDRIESADKLYVQENTMETNFCDGGYFGVII
jgi:hypothetical protein